MTKTEFIILPKFTSIEEGLTYLNDNAINFCFAVNDKIYNINSEEIISPDNSEIIDISNIYIGIHTDPQAGQLYIEDNFLKYYKEFNL